MGAEVIQRWFTCSYGSGLIPDERGDVVTYSDHAAALAAEKEKVRELVEALNLAIVHKYTHDGRILLEKYSKEEPNNE